MPFTGFPRVVRNQPGIAVRGNFADTNVRASVISGPGMFVAAPSPRQPSIGRFAWGDQTDASPFAYGRYFGETGFKLGFVHNDRQALLTAFLDESTFLVQAGANLTLMNQGSFWAEFLAGATPGQKVFANFLDGSTYAAAPGTSTQTASVTASLASTGVLTVSAVGSGTLRVGAVLAGVNIPAGVAITAQLSGTPGGTGTYQTTGTVVGASATVTASESVETDYFVDSPVVVAAQFTASLAANGVLTVSAVASGVLESGLQFAQASGANGLPPNIVIRGQISGTAGGTGDYRTNMQVAPVVTSQAMVSNQGTLAQISTWS